MREFLGLSKISPRICHLLQEIGRVGKENAQSVYVVGGFVRDLLLGRENLDIDIVVEGDAIDFAYQLATIWDGEVQIHQKFKTATVTRLDGLKLDFVSARNETYLSPGALPSVEYGTIAEDLRRRDFSINALAVQLQPDTFGEIVDCTDGLHDLRAGRIRALHEQSFIDDPTRIFRAIRYEARYRFQIVESDQQRIRNAINRGVLNLISGQRLRNEIDHILSEASAPQMVRRIDQFNIFSALHPTWKISPNFNVLWRAARQAIEWGTTSLPHDPINTKAILWMTLLNTPEAIKTVSSRLALESQLCTKLSVQAQLEHDLNTLSASSKPSEVYQLLHLYPLEPLVFALMQPNQPNWRGEQIANYLTHLKDVQPLITGDDLIQRGLKPGRAFSDLLWQALAAQLDGKVPTTQEIYQFLDDEK